MRSPHPPPSRPPSDPPRDHAAVVAANASFYAAFEALDLDAMGRVWSDTAAISCVHPGWSLLSGRAPVLASWSGIFRGTDRIKFSLRDLQVFISGSTAWIVLTEEIEAHHGTTVVHAFAQATNLFILESGTWKLVHHHAAAAASPEEKPRASSGPPRTLH